MTAQVLPFQEMTIFVQDMVVHKISFSKKQKFYL